MLELIESKLEELRTLCEAFGVVRLDLFGSAANGGFNADQSDLDFLVEFGPCTPGQHYERYFGLLEAVQALFGCPIDLVEAGAMRNPYFIRRVNESSVSLYAA